MDTSPHPVATEHLPFFLTSPGETDVLMVVMGAILVLAVLGFGVFFFRLHSLPEQIAHKSQKMQAEVVAVLCLISLFTHMHIFWIAGLVIAMIELPDFGTPLNRIAGSAERLAGLKLGEGAVESLREGAAHAHDHGELRDAPPMADVDIRQTDGGVPSPPRPLTSSANLRERTDA